MDPNCNYDGIDGISLRDESYEEAKPIIKQAFEEGYTNAVIDDGFMVFKQEIPGSEHFDNVEDMLAFAVSEWWWTQ